MTALTKRQEKKMELYFYCVAAGADPNGWRQPIRDTWEKYRGSMVAEAMARRYRLRQDRKIIYRKMGITKDTFYSWRREFLISAALAGIRSGLFI